MKGDPLPAAHNVVRYVGGSKRHGDTVYPQGFEGSPISVNWLECGDGSKDEQVDRVRGLLRMRRGRSAGLAELNVGTVRGLASGLDVVEDPLAASAEWPAAPCHAEIVGIPEHQPSQKLVCEQLADKVVNVYPARAGADEDNAPAHG